ncbi:2-dehydro-3-deoxyphosphooctonate aldolase [uncultured Flavobacterium sp.]|uniref:2-dehydro-3-deoxyphosphooctonate aldolase n=1 Tax=uncultured Flavobacterium sp. TaxID=165435 RepID=UPI0025F2CB07|nr:2-dehydro-3-deoxyphosphooctonate aldolase [uncultured Flavobacterium sp.]
MKKILLLSLSLIALTSCVSTRNTIRNINDDAKAPSLSVEKTFIITQISKDKKYGYDKDYPVNLGFMSYQASEINVQRYFGALTGPKGEKLSYQKTDTCCPFPSKRTDIGAGMLDIYEITWEGLTEPVQIYINVYEKGEIVAPYGFGIRMIE